MEPDPDWNEERLERATVTTSVNHLDAVSPAEREMLYAALQSLVDLLFDLYAALPPAGPPPNGFVHDGLLTFPPAYAAHYDRRFVGRAIVAAASLGQKLTGAQWFDLSSPMEALLFSTITESVQNTDIEIGDVFDDLEESLLRGHDVDALFDAPSTDDAGATEAWFAALPGTSFLNAYFADPRALAAPVQHALADPNAPDDALAYGIADDAGDERDDGVV